MKKFLVLVSALFLAACSTFHIKPETREVEPLPVEFSMYGEREVAPDKWWESFGSDELNKLIEASLSQNLSIKQAVARLKQAEAVSIQAGSSGRLNSEIDASASGSKGASMTSRLIVKITLPESVFRMSSTYGVKLKVT